MPRSYVAKGNKAAAKTPQELMREQMNEMMGIQADGPLCHCLTERRHERNRRFLLLERALDGEALFLK